MIFSIQRLKMRKTSLPLSKLPCDFEIFLILNLQYLTPAGYLADNVSWVLRLARLDAFGLVCGKKDGDYFKFRDKFSNSSIYDVIKDLAPNFNDTMGFCSSPLEIGEIKFYSCSNHLTPVLTEDGLCYAFNGINSHEMFTDE